MYIKSITLDGFKSYGNKVEIKGFDPCFNAVTGLNGSGKSNILDSICFCMGISNLNQVRANSLTELVYKGGQAGINKATVSITFDNSNKASCPLGYEQHKEIVITRTVITGGKTKYLINGVTANNNRVSDLFRSVQLNINNPHFLIMQGRITKVLSMKPLEVLSMVEEAAGTRMYEEKKISALKNLEKKDSKLREINNMLEEHICPQLEKLKEDRREFTKYNKVVREYDHLLKIYTAYLYTTTEASIQKSGEDKSRLQQRFEEHKATIQDLKNKIQESDERIKELEKKVDGADGNRLEELESALKAKQVIETKVDTQLRNLREAVREEKKKHSDLVKALKEERLSLAQKEKEFSNSEKKLETLKANWEREGAATAAAENHFHAVNAGLSDAAGEEASLAAQLIAAGKDKKDAETESKAIEMALKHLKSELAKKEAENKKVDSNYSKDQALCKKLEVEVQQMKAGLSKLNYDPDHFENLLLEERKLSMEMSRFKDEMESIFTKYPQLSFDYSDPEKNFDRRKVRGPVCLNVEIKDNREALALDLVASGKLYNVIVDDERVGKLLLSKGNLKRRCTVIPLNKIQGNVIDNRTLQQAENMVGRENVALALSRVSFERDLTPAMEYVFGNAFICPSMQPAKRVTFAQGIKKKSVTLEGEVFDPSGTLSGGSTGNRGRVLSEVAPIPKLKKSLEQRQQQMFKLQAETQRLKAVKVKYEALSEQYELKENEIKLLKSKIELSSHHKQIEELKRLQDALDEHKQLLSACKEKQKGAEKLIKELQAKSSKNSREDKVKEAERAVADCKRKTAAAMEKYNTFQAEVECLRMEIQSITEQSIPSYEEQIESCSKTMGECEKQLKEAEENYRDIKGEVSVLSEEHRQHKEMIKAQNTEIEKVSKGKDAMGEKISTIELQMQQLEHDIKQCEDSTVGASNKLKQLVRDNKWIESNKQCFGVPNSEFDFSSFNAAQAVPHLKELEALKEKLHKNVNMRAQTMLSSVEDQYESVIEKKGIVIHDKEVIESVIRELDEKKRQAVKTASETVNKSFGEIFSLMLPGAVAKLEPLPGKEVMEGLEMKVGFTVGKADYKSLNELSGGQRSLVALSLVLALLKFNPAPIYILDEVDSALDLSHTQNIGEMLKAKFKESQFLIVSLKDGMFNNANVLFRTKFKDGMSTVERFQNR